MYMRENPLLKNKRVGEKILFEKNKRRQDT